MEKTENQSQVIDEPIKKCGIVMPISFIDGCDESHWLEVLSIVKDAVSQANFTGELVSLSADVGVIHKRIVQNLYDNPIVVCDVSGKNPNVMFELGLRLAFDKPTIIIKDDETNYSFDTSPIEHLEYPRSLRFSQIIEFKKELKNKIIATYEKSQNDVNYSPFLKHFGDFTLAKLDSTEVSPQEYLMSQIEEVKNLIIERDKKESLLSKRRFYKDNHYQSNNYSISVEFDSYDEAYAFQKECMATLIASDTRVEEDTLKPVVEVFLSNKYPKDEAIKSFKNLLENFKEKRSGVFR